MVRGVNGAELIRVAEIAKEMGLKNPVVVGAQEGYRAIPVSN